MPSPTSKYIADIYYADPSKPYDKSTKLSDNNPIVFPYDTNGYFSNTELVEGTPCVEFTNYLYDLSQEHSNDFYTVFPTVVDIHSPNNGYSYRCSLTAGSHKHLIEFHLPRDTSGFKLQPGGLSSYNIPATKIINDATNNVRVVFYLLPDFTPGYRYFFSFSGNPVYQYSGCSFNDDTGRFDFNTTFGNDLVEHYVRYDITEQ